MTAWLNDLLSGNADDIRLRSVVDAHLAVPTLADQLPEVIARGELRAVLLVAHAGDGKSHIMRAIEAKWDTARGPVRQYPACDYLDEPGLHILNDPSPLDRVVARRFFDIAFGEKCPPGAVFVAGANRGLLRELRSESGSDWLAAVQRADPAAHHPDGLRRVAVPLDRRCLVPGPAAPGSPVSSPHALARTLSERIFRRASEESGRIFPVARWADRVCITLAMVEGSGHHVTFREVGALAALVALALIAYSEPEEAALRALFLDLAPPQALHGLAAKLRRTDPARVATPEEDGKHGSSQTRDAVVRAENLDLLLDLFRGVPPARQPRLPYRHGVHFLRLCGALAGANSANTVPLRKITELRTTSPALADALAGASLRFAESAVPADREAYGALLVGLSRIAWSSPGRGSDRDALPLTSALQPGSTAGVQRWRVLRAALGLESFRFAAHTSDPGAWVEAGLLLPELRVIAPVGATPPGLRLDLELFELLARAGESANGLPSLGAREGQLRGWLEGIASAWEPVLARPTEGFIVYQTLIRAGTDRRDSVPLRPPQQGVPPEPLAEIPACREVLPVLSALWRAPPIAVTPSACAAALLLWAGVRPPEHLQPSVVDRGAAAEALGAGTLPGLRAFRNLRSACFPWSTWTLGLTLLPAGERLVARYEVPALLDLGTACAGALGLTDAWAPWLRAAWARDESRLDDHPSSLLAHQWLQVGAGRIQLSAWTQESIPPCVGDRWLEVAAWLLSPNANVTATERWSLLGTWAAWRVFLEGLRAWHAHPSLPLILPRVGGDGQSDYERVRDAWLFAKHTERADKAVLEAVVAVGQASSFVRAPTLKTRVDLPLSGPGGLVDIVRIAAGHLVRTVSRPDGRRVDALQDILLDFGLYTHRGGARVDERLPAGTIARASPVSERFEAALRACLEAEGLLDAASDGAALVRDPWPGATP